MLSYEARSNRLDHVSVGRGARGLRNDDGLFGICDDRPTRNGRSIAVHVFLQAGGLYNRRHRDNVRRQPSRLSPAEQLSGRFDRAFDNDSSSPRGFWLSGHQWSTAVDPLWRLVAALRDSEDNLPVFLAWFLVRNADRVGELKATLLPMLLVVGLVSGLIFVEPDLGTTLVICAIFAAVYFAAGAKLIHVAAVGGVFVTGVAAALYFAPWRMRRLGAFLDPCDPVNAAGAGYQVCQSLYATARVVCWRGLCPRPAEAILFAVPALRLHIFGGRGGIRARRHAGDRAAFAVLLWRGTRAALNAPDRFGTLLGIGLITGITVQALFNISVVISILPAKGIPLPFISYGGSSVLVTLAAVGVLLSIAAAGEEDPAERPAASGVRRKKARSGLK